METEDPDYYFDENGNLVFTEAYHLKRGYCCRNGCCNCPWRYGRANRRDCKEEENK